MRKPRNYDEDLKALTAKARQLKARKQSQLGELVEATGADASPSRNWPARCCRLPPSPIRRDGRHGANAALRSFLASGPNRRLAHALATTRNQQRRTTSARHRLALQQARHDTRAWQVKRRERTRQLIELGGLIAKAGLVELTDDDRAVILGLLVEAAAKLRTDETGNQLTLWRRRGQRAFADTETKTEQPATRVPPSIASALPRASRVAIGTCMDDKTKTRILGVIERAPQWLRNDLAAKDPAARARAEEALARCWSMRSMRATRQPVDGQRQDQADWRNSSAWSSRKAQFDWRGMMNTEGLDPHLLHAWLAARSLARGCPCQCPSMAVSASIPDRKLRLSVGCFRACVMGSRTSPAVFISRASS
jgi:hypothetical protein